MNTNFTIKNFRVFDENGATIQLKPLTILTGCNSSGKSTIVKAMLILKHFFMQIKNAIDMKAPINLFSYKIDIATNDLKSLGNFANTINKGTESSEVTFEYIIYSRMLSKDVKVCLSFSVDDNDELKNGILQNVSMSIEDIVFYYANRNGYTCNLNAVKDACIDFLELEYLIHGYCSVCGEYEFDSIQTKSKEEYEALMTEAKNTIKGYDEKRSKDVLKYVYSSQAQNQDILRSYGINQSIFDWTRENGSFFWIPVISELDKVGKEGVLSFIAHKLLTEKDTEDMRFAYDKIVNDFISSDESSFSSYFKCHENEFFGAVKYNRFGNEGNTPRIYDFTISQNYSSFNPGRWEPIYFDEESNTKKEGNNVEEANQWKNRPVTFPILYEIVMLWNKSYSEGKERDNDYYTFVPGIEPVGGYIHHAYRALGAFFSNIVSEVLNPDPWIGIAYASSSRVEANSYYSLSDYSNFSIALKRYFDVRRVFQEKKLENKSKFGIGSYINRWIHDLGIGERISFKVFENLEVVSPILHKQLNDDGCFLTDVGFGITQLLSVLMTVETQILSRIIDAYSYKGINRIWGITDLFEMYDNWGKDAFKMRSYLYDTIAIEEPEIHLHPNYQSKLAEVFAEAYTKWGVHFVIETHSEYLIRKLQVMVVDKEETLTTKDISLNYVERDESGASENRKIEVLEDGRLSEPFGTGFFDESKKLVMKMMQF